MNKIPKDWSCDILNKLVIKIQDRDHITPVYTESGVPLISPTNFRSVNNIDFDSCRYISVNDHKINRKKTDLEIGDVLLSRIGTIGLVRYLDKYNNFSVLHSIVQIRPNTSRLNGKYLFYALQTDFVKSQIRKELQSIGVPDLGIDKIREFYINLPEDVNEQSQIAKILTKIDEAIDQTEKIIEKNERIKRGLMQDLFTKGIDENGNIRNEETHKFIDSPIGRIPEEWNETTLLKTLNNNKSLIVGGPFGSNLKVSDYEEEGVPLIRLQNIERNEFILKDMKYISEIKARTLNYHSFISGDIVLAKLGDPIGKTCIIPYTLKSGIVVSDVVRIRADYKKINVDFLVRILNSAFVTKQLTQDIIGTTRPRVNLDQVRNIRLFLPSKKEQDLIANNLISLDKIILQENYKLSKLKRIKAGLMQDLLTGKVRVNHLINQKVVA